MKFPLISVIVPAYNASAYIGATLDSVLGQTYRNIEVLVVDDGSQDQTAEIVELYRRVDDRVVLLKQQNSGVAAARNLGIAQAQGVFVAPLDADDIWYPRKLELQVQCFQESAPEVGLVYTWSALIDEAGSILWSVPGIRVQGNVLTPLVFQNFVGNGSVPLIRRSCFETVGGYDTNLKQRNAQGCEDWDLYLRIAEHYHFRLVPEILVGYRQVVGSMACNFQSMARSYHLVIEGVRSRRPEVPRPVYAWSNSNFYLYLMDRCYDGGDYWNTLRCVWRAGRSDLAALLRMRIYPLMAACILKLLTQPLLKPEGRPSHEKAVLEAQKSRQASQRAISWLYNRIRAERFAQITENV